MISSSGFVNFPDLPILPLLPECRRILTENTPLLLTAEPGAGKTTIVPLALLDEPWLEGRKIFVLEPRRLAAYAGAGRMAELLGETPGETVGWRTGEETKASPRTRIEVLTEGVLTRMLVSDPELRGVGAVLFDEFHERTLAGDEGLAFFLDVRRNLRPDLRLGILSATLDTEVVRRVVPDGVEVHSPGRSFPVGTIHRPPRDAEAWIDAVARAVVEGWDAVRKGILVFLPGWSEIQRVKERIDDVARERGEVVAFLHGTLAREEQSAVLKSSSRRRTVLSSAVAETSLTLPDIELVIDSGWSRSIRFDAGSGLNRLVTERVSRATADQRRGRAGRTAPGICWRIWPASETLEPFAVPEILKSDLSGVVLDSILWGAGRPDSLSWVTEPPRAGWDQAIQLLQRLHAVDETCRPTKEGREMGDWGLPPRLGHLLARGKALGWGATAAAVAAVLEERDRSGVVDQDFRRRLANPGRNVEKRFRSLIRRLGAEEEKLDPDKAGLLLAAAYPERIARRQWGPESSPQGPASQFQASAGRSLRVVGELARENWLAVAEAEFGDGVGQVYSAAPLTTEDVESLAREDAKTVWEVEGVDRAPRLFRVRRLGALILERTGVPLQESPDTVIQAWIHSLRRPGGLGLSGLPWDEEGRTWLSRVRFWARNDPRGPSYETWTDDALFFDLEAWVRPFLNLSGGPLLDKDRLQQALQDRLGWEEVRRLDPAVPRWLILPSGSRRRLDYPEEGDPYLRVKLQEVFGWKDSPTVCGRRVVLHLLSPAQRPLQITSDLAGFWGQTYLEVRKEMRGRYPKHAWPEDPRS